ncbi:MAG TPA: hypothetical protein VGB85_31315, partial [Nannocystis sp.]
TNTSGATTSGTTTDAPTTANPTTGTTTDGTTNPTSGTTGDAPTTGVTTGEATTIGTMTSDGTTGGTTSDDTDGTTQGTLDTETTGGGLYGNCGWNVVGYYACVDKGGVAGTEDPLMKDEIACPQNIMEGAACNDMGMGGIGSVGCCTPEGVNFFCDVEDTKKVFRDDCEI